jgi:hypothetical protein
LKKKQQKNFIRAFGSPVGDSGAEGVDKVFWFFFSKKNGFLP